MSYAFAFNASQISGNTQAKLIDDTFRNMHSALIERLNDKLVVDATADPWVLLNSVSGAKDEKFLALPFNHFTTLGGGSTSIFLDRVVTTGDANALVCGFSLPPGVTIKEAAVYISPTGTVNMELYKIPSSPPFTKVSVAAWSDAVAGQHVSVNGSTLADVVANFVTYYISVDLASSSSGLAVAVYGGYVKYSTPSHLNTL